jgi:hypothetical protein
MAECGEACMAVIMIMDGVMETLTVDIMAAIMEMVGVMDTLTVDIMEIHIGDIQIILKEIQLIVNQPDAIIMQIHALEQLRVIRVAGLHQLPVAEVIIQVEMHILL